MLEDKYLIFFADNFDIVGKIGEDLIIVMDDSHLPATDWMLTISGMLLMLMLVKERKFGSDNSVTNLQILKLLLL